MTAHWFRVAQDTSTETHIYVPDTFFDKFSIYEDSSNSFSIRGTKETTGHVIAEGIATRDEAAALLQTLISGVNLLG